MHARRAISVSLLLLASTACGWNPSRPFERESPEVKQAIKSLRDGGDATVAVSTLEDYLSTGPCADGNIGTPEVLRRKADGTFDLGLSLFKIGEAFGRRFGEEEREGGTSESKAMRGAEVGCAIRILGQVAADETVPFDLRARARYLEGNLNFLDSKYEDAVHAYDKALGLLPGSDGGDAVGRDAAWNRAIALQREEDEKKKDAGHDASPDSPNEGGKDGGHDGGGSKDSGQDAPHDSGGQDSGRPDAGSPPPPQNPDAAPPPPPRPNEDERMLDQLENAPTVQQEAAKKLAARRRVRGMADK